MSIIKKNLSRIIPTVLLAVGIAGALLFFIHNNSNRISTQNEEYIQELTLQRAISIDNLIEENLSFISSIAYLYGKGLTSPEADIDLIRDYEESTTFDMLRFVDNTGENYTSSGPQGYLGDREYYQAGMRGESGITYVLQSRVTGQRQIGFYAPVIFEDNIIGVMVGFYGEDYIRKLLDYDLFGYNGEGWLLTRDGTVLGSTLESDPGNYLIYIAEYKDCTEEELSAIQSGLASGKRFSFVYRENDLQTTGFTAPLTQTDWLLIRIFPPSASQQILNNANGEGERLIIELVILFILYTIYLSLRHIYDQKRLREANLNANYVSTGVARLFDYFITVDLVNEEYAYINCQPSDMRLAAKGPYNQFRDFMISRIKEEERRKEADALFDVNNLKEQLKEIDRVSVRLHAPLHADEWYTLNFIVISRDRFQAPDRLLLVFQDVSDLHQKELAEQSRLQEALVTAEKASKAKTEFLFNMSHDLRTPMNAIIGYTQLSQREGVTEEEMHDYVTKIDASSKHLLALINDILEMSRIESQKLTIDPVKTDLIEVMDEVRSMFSTQMEEKRINFTVNTDEVQDRWVLCDQNALNRVLLNLVSNACKFTETDGEINVSLRQTGSSENQASFEIRVKDNGIGMSPEFREKLFTPFERERSSTVSGIQGTGLGLSISRNIVTLMGGTIDVETEQGKGTEFILNLTFPITEPEVSEISEPESVAEETDQFNGKRLLLAEDNEINREIALMILEEAGLDVDSAENGEVVVEMFRDSQPGTYDAILMDIQMPVMTGYEATRTIRALSREDAASIPIIAMTANAFKEDIDAALEAGMNAHIAKPLDIGKMMETLREYL